MGNSFGFYVFIGEVVLDMLYLKGKMLCILWICMGICFRFKVYVWEWFENYVLVWYENLNILNLYGMKYFMWEEFWILYVSMNKILDILLLYGKLFVYVVFVLE